MTFGFDTRWGDTIQFFQDFSEQTLLNRVVEFSGNDIINVPGRGQPRVFLATWIWDYATVGGEGDYPISLDELWIDWFVGVGQTNLRTRTTIFAPRVTDPVNYIKLPAETLRARFGGKINVPENPAAEQRSITVNMTLIVGPYFPFGQEERQSIRGGYLRGYQVVAPEGPAAGRAVVRRQAGCGVGWPAEVGGYAGHDNQHGHDPS